jgi:serine/threonine protein kinase
MTTKSDVWGFGAIVFTALLGFEPFYGDLQKDLE